MVSLGFPSLLLAQQEGLSADSPGASVTPDGMAEADRIIVTGSNIPSAAEVGPNPVDTYNKDDITRLGARTPTDLIQRLPAAFGAGFNEGTTGTGEGSASISLRGIDPKETLVLQDGRRLANGGLYGAAVDFNLFPFGLIDHIDVLKDGASPIYGTDAVAGVVNVYLIHKFRGLELYASYGNTNFGSANDMGQEVTYLLAGTGDDKTNLVLFAGYFNQAAIFSRDVDISRSVNYRDWGGLDARSGNFAGRVDEFVYDPSRNGGMKSPTPHSSANVTDNPEYAPCGDCVAFDFPKYTPLIAPSDRQYFYGSFDRELCPKALTVFADFEYVRRFWGGELAPRPIQGDIWIDADHPFGLSPSGFSVPIQNPFNPFTVADYVSPGGSGIGAAPPGTGFTTGVRYRFLEAGSGTRKITANTTVFTGGARGALDWLGDYFKNWNWEAGLRWNEDAHTEIDRGIFNNFALREALLDTNPATALNPFGLNQNSREVIDRIRATTTEFATARVLTEDFILNGDLFKLPAGPVSFALGGQHLSDHFFDQPDGLTEAGQISGFTVFATTRGSRDSWATFWEARIPVTSSTWNVPGFHSLEFDYAERFEDFSDFGSTERPKFSVRWEPFGGSPVPVTLRASYIEAYHAPGLLDLYAGSVVGFPPIFDPVTNTFVRGVQTIFTSNPNLQPEIAYEHTFGGVVTPAAWWSGFRGLTFTVDYGHIDLRGFSIQPDPQVILDNEARFPGTIHRDPVTGDIILIVDKNQNLGGLVETYIDYQALEKFETIWLGHGDWGTFTAAMNGTYLADVRLKLLPGDKPQHVVGKYGGGFQGFGGGGAYTHNRWYASLFYDGPASSWLHGADIGATVHYTGQYWDSPFFTKTFDDRKVREWTTADLILNYTFNPVSGRAPNAVPGYAKGMASDSKSANISSTAEYNPCGWSEWLRNTTLTVGVNNVFDLAPPFVAAAIEATGAAENGFDETTADAKGRFWYMALRKRF